MLSGEISSYDSDRIRAFLDANVRTPPVYLDVAKRFHLETLTGRIVARLTRRGRARLAARRWLDPAENCSLADLDRLQDECGFRLEHPLAFRGHLYQDVKDLAEGHPSLRLWALRRLGLLDYVVTTLPRVAVELLDVATALRRELILLLRESKDSAHEQLSVDRAERLTSVALRAAAQVVADVFRSGTRCEVSANLMLCGQHWVFPGQHRAMEVILSNHRRAARLWQSFDAVEERLVVVAETRESQHLGFWVPAPALGSAIQIPGATTAYRLSMPSAVFRDDLPRISGVPPQTEADWRAYLKDHFHYDLFVSLPLRAPSTEVGQRRPIAVLNVNVNPSSDWSWRRAYHQEWLESASARAAQFAEIAYWAVLWVAMAAPNQTFSRKGDNPMWDSLPTGAGASL